MTQSFDDMTFNYRLMCPKQMYVIVAKSSKTTKSGTSQSKYPSTNSRDSYIGDSQLPSIDADDVGNIKQKSLIGEKIVLCNLVGI